MIPSKVYSRGELARALGCSPKALRHYEAQGLFSPSRDAGQRRYDDRVLARLRLVVALRQIGFSTSRISRLLSQRGRGVVPPLDAAKRLAEDLSEVTRHLGKRIEYYQRLRHELIATRESLSNCARCEDPQAKCDECVAAGRIGPMTRTLLFDP